MPSLVPELVKKRCKPISAESHDSVNVTKKAVLGSLLSSSINPAMLATTGFGFGGMVAAAA